MSDDAVVALVDRFAERPVPASGVVSRSRLRSWFREQGGHDDDWIDFVRLLTSRNLWKPWTGRDITVHASAPDAQPETQDYRAPPPEPTLPTLHAEVVETPGVGLGCVGQALTLFGLICLTWRPALGGVMLVLAAVAGVLAWRQTNTVFAIRRIDQVIRITRNQLLVHEAMTRDIDWVDVIRVDSTYTVVLRRKDGQLIDLKMPLTKERALAFCRGMEAALREGELLARANRAQIRAAESTSIEEAEIHEIEKSSDEQAAEV